MKHTKDIQSAVTNIKYYADKIKELCGKQADNLPNESNIDTDNALKQLAIINDSSSETIKTCCNIILEKMERCEGIKVQKSMIEYEEVIPPMGCDNYGSLE